MPSALILAALAVGLLLHAGAAVAEVACPFPEAENWSATTPSVNQNHVFCGEWSRGRPKGFHARPGGVDPATVGGARIASAANPQGIYSLEWWYLGQAGTRKGSTMFPDGCSRQQVLNSILHAANHPVDCVPAVPWGTCGPNRPDPLPSGQDFCVGRPDAPPWQIRFATIRVDGRTGVNTAFPNR